MGFFSLVGLKLKHSKCLLRSHGLQSSVIELDNGCKIHCWAPSSSSLSASSPPPNRIHGSDSTNNQHFDPTSPSCPCSPLSSNCNATTTTTHHKSADNLQSIDVKHLDPNPISSPPSKPALLLLHGFGGHGTLSWEYQLAEFSKHFSLYLPDLLFFGNSTIADELNSGPDTHTQQDKGSPMVEEAVRYSEIFQAECMYKTMKKMGVREAVVLGHSYGGFVAYRMAHLYPRFVKRLVILSAGIMMNPHSNEPLLRKSGATRIHDLLVPTTLPIFIKSLQLVLNDYLPTWLPSFLYKDMLESFAGDRKRRLQLVDGIILGKEDAPPLPTIEQSTLILWGEEDQIFDVTLAHQLKEFLGEKAKLVTMKGVGHVPHMVKPKEFNGVLLAYLLAKQ